MPLTCATQVADLSQDSRGRGGLVARFPVLHGTWTKLTVILTACTSQTFPAVNVFFKSSPFLALLQTPAPQSAANSCSSVAPCRVPMWLLSQRALESGLSVLFRYCTVLAVLAPYLCNYSPRVLGSCPVAISSRFRVPISLSEQVLPPSPLA